MIKFIVYGLIDPNSKQIRYIGKSMTGLNRANQHYTNSSLKRDGNTPKANWIRKLKDNNQKYEIVILFKLENNNLNKQQINQLLYEKEQEFINFYKSTINDLTNLQDAGPGSPSRQISEETRIKMSESAKKRGLNKALKDQQKPKYPVFKDKKYCSKCQEVKELSFFKKNSRDHVCNICFNKNRKSRAIPGSRQKYADSMGIKIKAINLKNNENIEFKSLRDAARIIGGKCSKTGIRLAIQKQRSYYGFIWSKI